MSQSGVYTSGGGGGGSVTINGDTSSVSGSTLNIITGFTSGPYANGTIAFNGDGATTLTLNSTDGNSNTALGSNAFESISGTSGVQNNGFGAFAGAALAGSSTGNCLFGLAAGQSITNASATGYNCAFGNNALGQVVGGTYNLGFGNEAGFNLTGTESSNIYLNNIGTLGESNKLRIGTATGTGNQDLNAAFICGITGIVVTGANAQISSGNQLGVASSSSRFKENIIDMGDASNALHKLRPVSYTWKKDSAPGLKDAPDIVQHGLIAEEAVHHVPHVVNLDKDGRPFNINYDQLVGMLINEVQKLREEIDALKKRG